MDNEPLDNAMIAKVLRRAGERVLTGWIQYYPIRKHGLVDECDRRAGCVVESLFDAYREVYGLAPGAGLPGDVMSALLIPVLAAHGGPGVAHLAAWNDAPGRTPEEVNALCVAGAELAEVRG